MGHMKCQDTGPSQSFSTVGGFHPPGVILFRKACLVHWAWVFPTSYKWPTDACSPPGPPQPATPDVQHSSPRFSFDLKKDHLEEDGSVSSLSKRHFFLILPELLFPPSSFYSFLGFALGLAFLNQNNSHNAREKCFPWMSDIRIKASKPADFCPLKTLVSECRGEVSGVTRGDCGDACSSELFSRKPSAQTLGSPGTQEQHPHSAEMKGEAGWSSWRLLLSQQGPAAVAL